jgi:hypothetical protein
MAAQASARFVMGSLLLLMYVALAYVQMAYVGGMLLLYICCSYASEPLWRLLLQPWLLAYVAAPAILTGIFIYFAAGNGHVFLLTLL